jgi:hypothetical protein
MSIKIFEDSKYFDKRIYEYEDTESPYWDLISEISYYYKISKKQKYVVDLRESHEFFYDGTWLYDYISPLYWLVNTNINIKHDFEDTIKYFRETYGDLYELLEMESGQILVHRVKKTPEEVLEMVDIAWSNGSWGFDPVTMTSHRGLGKKS